MEFKPMLTPKEMLHKGIFGGTYFAELIDYKDFPEDWFEDLEETAYKSTKYLVNVNLFKIKSGHAQKEWEAKGWIHPDDPRGWFEWYCKYFLGRRHEDDDRQIKRWAAFCGPKGRWRNTIYSKIHADGCDVDFSEHVSSNTQQSLLHWSYLVNRKDYSEWLQDRTNAKGIVECLS
jgi:hypothetical protein